MAEIVRAGIISVDEGQSEASAALGMTRMLAMRRIILPQAIRIVIPTLGNYFIGLFKDTALCSVVSIQEVVFTAQILAARNFLASSPISNASPAAAIAAARSR